MAQAKFINGSDIRIVEHNEKGLVIYCNSRLTKKGIKPKRLFTISNPYSYIQLVQENGAEIGILKDMSELDPKSQDTLREALNKFYVIPRILKINSIEEEYGVSKWDVLTDRGPRTFEVRSRNTDIRLLDNRVLIRDADNNRYEIDDYKNLPKESYRLLESEI